MKAAAGSGFSTATDLADWLVRSLGMPFRDAHHLTGRIVALAADRGVALCDLSIEDMRRLEPEITADALTVLSVEASAASRTSYGGTAPEQVARQARSWRERLRSAG